MKDLYRNQLRLVLRGYQKTFGDLSELYSTRELIKARRVNKYSDITIQELTNRISELENESNIKT